MDPLRQLSCSMPYEKKGTLMNGVIVAEPNAAFLKKWFFLGYNDFEVIFFTSTQSKMKQHSFDNNQKTR